MQTIGKKACVEQGCLSSNVSSKGNAFANDRNTARLGRAPGRVDSRAADQSHRVAVPMFAAFPSDRPARTTSPKGANASGVIGTATTRRIMSPGRSSSRTD